MAEFIFDLQRFDGDGGSGGSSSGSSGGTGASSGGSNASTDGSSSIVLWKDDWKAYSTKDRSSFAATAYTLLQATEPTVYVAADGAANAITVSGLNNNFIYNVDRFDNIKFTDLYLESFALFYNYAESAGYVDMIFSSGTVTRLYLADTEFTPLLTFASGLSEAYAFPSDEKDADGNTIYPGGWFGSDDLMLSTAYWNADGILNNYVGYVSTAGVDGIAEVLPVSRTVNTFVSAGDQDNIYLYDVASLADIYVKPGYANSVPTVNADGEVENTQSNALNLVFSNGTAALVYYTDNDLLPTRTYSPTFYLADGSAYVYNSELGWRTYDQAAADKTAADAAAAQEAAEKAAFDLNFNRVYDAAGGTFVDNVVDAFGVPQSVTQTVVDDNFTTSRCYNTMVYSGSSTDDIYFSDALVANVIGVVHEDDSHFDIFFDTGALARIEYSDVVSPIFHFADGAAYAYNYATKEFIPAYSGTKASSLSTGAADLAESDDLVESDDLTHNQDGSWTDGGGTTLNLATDGSGKYVDAKGNTYTYNPTTDRFVRDSTTTTVTDGNTVNVTGDNTRSLTGDSSLYEVSHEDFVVSSGQDTFINKVTALDDIHIPDAGLANITDIDITSDFNIVITFNTGKTLRVIDNSIISPVFHLADGSNVVYNWSANQWTGVTEATSTEAENFPAFVGVNNFIRNAGDEDFVYFDTTANHVAQVQTDHPYYVVYTFDNGSSTAVRYTDTYTPTFVFADGTTSRYSVADDDEFTDVTTYDTYNSGDTEATETQSFDLSKGLNNMVYEAGSEDNINFVDAASSDVVSFANPNGYTIDITFNTGKFTTVEWWEYFSPLFNFTDGKSFAYDYSAKIWGNGYRGTTGVADPFVVSHGESNVMHNLRASEGDSVTFVDANLSDVTGYDVLNSNNMRLVFNNGTTTTIQFWEINSPTIAFADGNTLSYNFTTEQWTDSATTATHTFSSYQSETLDVSKNSTNIINEAGDEDIVVFTDATRANITNVSGTADTVTLTFDSGKTTTVNYLYLYSPTFVFADGTALQYYFRNDWYNAYVGTTGAAELVTLSQTVGNRVQKVGAADTIHIADAASTDISSTYISTSSYDPYIQYTFKNGKTTTIYYNDEEGAATPNIVFGDGTSYQYNTYTTTYGQVDDIMVSKNNNSIVYSADDDDNIAVVDASFSDITSYSGTSSYTMQLTFDTGKTLNVGKYNDVSPTFFFADGGNYAYVSSTDSWAAPIDASGSDALTLSSAETNIVKNTDESDTIGIDAARAAVTGINTDRNGTISLMFGDNTSTTVNYATPNTGTTANTTPLFVFTDDTLQYDMYSPSYQQETFNLSSSDNSIIYEYAYPEDVVNFTDATRANITGIRYHDYSYVEFTFDTGATTDVSYLNYVRGVTPMFTFTDGTTYRYVNENAADSVSADKNVWQKYDSTTDTWSTTSDFAAIPATSADMASSADLWGDVAPADDLFAGGSFVTDAALSDLVAPAEFATSFDAADVFGTQSAGDFVIAATDSAHKTA